MNVVHRPCPHHACSLNSCPQLLSDSLGLRVETTLALFPTSVVQLSQELLQFKHETLPPAMNRLKLLIIFTLLVTATVFAEEDDHDDHDHDHGKSFTF